MFLRFMGHVFNYFILKTKFWLGISCQTKATSGIWGTSEGYLYTPGVGGSHQAKGCG